MELCFESKVGVVGWVSNKIFKHSNMDRQRIMDALDTGRDTTAVQNNHFTHPEFDSDTLIRSLMTPPTNETRHDHQRMAPTTAPNHLLTTSSKVESFLQELNVQIGRVKKSLHHHVTDNQDFLMERLSNVSLLFSDIKQVRAGVSLLQTSTQRIRREILDPLEDMRVQSKRLAKVQQASMLLRRATQVIRLAKSLRLEIARFPNVLVHEDGRIERKKATLPSTTTPQRGGDGTVSTAATTTATPEAALTAVSEVVADLPKTASLVHDIETMFHKDVALAAVVSPSLLVLVKGIIFDFSTRYQYIYTADWRH